MLYEVITTFDGKTQNIRTFENSEGNSEQNTYQRFMYNPKTKDARITGSSAALLSYNFV